MKVVGAFLLAFAYWEIVSYMRNNLKIDTEEKHVLFVGVCILLAAWIIAGGV